MIKVPLLFPFFLAVFATVYATVFFTHCHLQTFAPFLALLYCRCSRVSSLWLSSLCGLFLDVLGSEGRFGIYALSFAATTLLFYNQKKHFYDDKPLALSLFTFQLSFVITLFLFLSSFSVHLMSLKSVMSDFVVMPLIDSLYAYLWFSCPMYLYRFIKQTSLRTWLSRLSFWYKPNG